MFENEWFPIANKMGVSWNEFWEMNPRILSAIQKGYEEKRQDKDLMMWLQGQYELSAFYTAIENLFLGKKSKSKYFDKPILQKIKNQNTPCTDNEIKKKRELFVARLMSMKANFDLQNKKREEDKT